MRKLALVAALATTALATPAFATDGAWYVGVEGGAMLVEDMHIDIGTTNNAVNVNHRYGGDFDAVAGYDFGKFRVEGEIGYKQAFVKSFDTTITPPGGLAAGTFDGGRGKTRALSAMLNAMLDLGDNDVSGFIGGGAGYARVSARNYSAYSNSAAFLDDNDSRFAWQVIAGVRTALTDTVDVGLKYRFFNVDKLRMTAFNAPATGANSGDTHSRFRSHSLLGSLIFNFGTPPAPPPPAPPPPPAAEAPPPPPPPAPEAPAAVVPGPFIVFFDWDKSAITPEAAAILDNAASAYATTGQASVMLAGHADKSGSDAYNVGLSQRRADAVKAYLAGKGVADGSITTEAFGESRPLVETADGVREPQNRRVEITFGPGSGQ